MHRRRLQALAALWSALLLVSCTAEPPEQPQSLSLGAQMLPSAHESGTLVFRNASVEVRRYSRFMIEPVEVYSGPDAHFGGVSEQEVAELAQFMHAEFTRAIGERYPIVRAAAPDVARLKLTLAGIESNTPFVATASRVLPIGLAANLAKSAVGAPGSFTGSVTFAGQLYDATSNELIAAFLTRQAPDALDVRATLSTRDAAQAAISDSAMRLRNAIDRMQAGQ